MVFRGTTIQSLSEGSASSDIVVDISKAAFDCNIDRERSLRHVTHKLFECLKYCILKTVFRVMVREGNTSKSLWFLLMTCRTYSTSFEDTCRRKLVWVYPRQNAPNKYQVEDLPCSNNKLPVRYSEFAEMLSAQHVAHYTVCFKEHRVMLLQKKGREKERATKAN